ncbi:TIGR02647 family protein [Pistricoccus aurantiacus]|uniref:TIGR02647 family protein n=1 Tax=Pistricoccus aurantiacus TaxID=1883414 RepID=A0A5B8SWI9_9GAMM|nr:TIGR02647 family protein [Pistricoccus aurantiacus]QEA40517.1 TIGR02647 family protein [Pistricoccus aurantiacus]
MPGTTYTPELLEELKILCLFNLNTTQEGIKVHSSAAPEAIAATRRLHDKGLITQDDGGYLTSLGLDGARHAQDLLGILLPANVTS